MTRPIEPRPRPRLLAPVEVEPATPLTYDEANTLFREAWSAARQAYGDVQFALGTLATPLFKQTPVSRTRIGDAIYQAERATTAFRELTASLNAVHELYDRTEPPPTPTVRYRRVK